jgi:leucyl aminopeptidase
MQISAITQTAGMADADTIVLGLFEGDGAPKDSPAQVTELLDSGEARASFKALALAHADGRRWLLVGLGAREQLTAERARVAAAVAQSRAQELSTRALCWQLPDGGPGAIAGALVEGTVLSAYRFELHKSASAGADAKTPELERLIVAGAAGAEDAVAEAALVAAAVNRARDLQNRPGNDLTPTALGSYARALGEQIEGLSVRVDGRDGIVSRGMGSFAAVAQGSEQEPALITMRYDGTGGGSDETPPAGPTHRWDRRWAWWARR